MKQGILAGIWICMLCGTVCFAQDYYTVKAGDNLEKIAKAYDTKIDSIQKWNGLKDHKIITGKKLIVNPKVQTPQSDSGSSQSQEAVSSSTDKNKTSENTQTEAATVKLSVNPSKTDTEKPAGSRKDTSDNEKSQKKTPSRWYLWLLLGFVVGVVSWEKWLRRKVLSLIGENNSHDTLEETYQDDIRDLKNDKKQLANQVKELESKMKNREKQYNQLLDENIQLGQKIEKLESLAKMEAEQDEIQTANSAINSTETTASTLYADAIIDGSFNRIKTAANEDTVYEITRISARTATFRIYPDAYKRVLKNPDFIDGCDKQKINASPQTLEVETGETAQDDFGKWQITKKAKIKFI
jgi:LysM repeat protein